MKTKRRKRYEKARNIKDNNISKVSGKLRGMKIKGRKMINAFITAGAEQQRRDLGVARGAEKLRRIKNNSIAVGIDYAKSDHSIVK